MTRAAENELFNRWQETAQIVCFVRDGAGQDFWNRAGLSGLSASNANLRQNSSAARILFILKEANDGRAVDPEPANWDLRESLDDTAKGRTLINLARWAAHVLYGASCENVSATVARTGGEAVLRHAAMLNLKKKPGGAVASMTEIYGVALRDQEFIREQIRLYRPDLTIACGTFWIVEKIFGLAPDARGGDDPCHVHRHPDLGALVSFWHPQTRKSSEWLFHRFTAAFESL